MSKITESARNEMCELQIPGVCNGNRETTVWCHSNKQCHGKGFGKKSLDLFGAFGCSACHDVYDRRRKPPAGMTYAEVEDRFAYGHARSLTKLVAKGLVIQK